VIAKELGISRNTVRKYRNEVEKKVAEVINTSKIDIEKLELIKNLTPKQIKDILYHNEVLKTNDKIEIQTEEVGRALFGAIGDTHL
jgi:predicted transcriptional regulator